jgi:hypothetical protein
MSPKVPFACELFLSDGVFPAITGDNKGLQAPPSPSHSNSMINRSIPPTIEIIPAKRCLNFRVRSHSRQWQELNFFAHFESAHAMMVSDASLVPAVVLVVEDEMLLQLVCYLTFQGNF